MKQFAFLKHGFAVVSLLVSLITYTLTVQPTVPFWDCGEFTAATVEQQVPHPPGAPLFLMVGKLFHLLPIGDPAVRVNMVSVVASSITVWLLYYIIIMAIQWHRKTEIDSVGAAITVFGSALVGALAFTFSDTFWFNAVESEVYASSSVFVAIVVYLMMRWNEVADQPGHERYLLLLAYLLGLSTGVHLLSILAVFSIVLIVYFRRYSVTPISFAVMGVAALFTFYIVYVVVVQTFPALLAGKLPFKNEALEYSVENSDVVRLLGWGTIIMAAIGAGYGYLKNMRIVALVCSSFVLMFVGYTTYTHILVRSNANPPMNENSPKTLDDLISYLGRDQYGNAPTLLPRRYSQEGRYREGYLKHGKWNPPPMKTVISKDGQLSYSVPDLKGMKLNMSGEMDYLFDYQLNHMYWRYFLWNFVGRTSDIQDSPSWSFGTKQKDVDEINFLNGYAEHFPIRFFYLPFLLGFIGLIYQFKNDPKMALVMFTMFLVMGVVAAFAQNQQDPQPRERDYFYTGSFMVWCLWIGYGIYACIDWAKAVSKPAIAGGIFALGIVAVPVNMGYNGWFIHSRAGNYVPFDYSYNILQSCKPNAILFTNGDNDTFPLWLLQDVYGVRRDIRIVNLSLGNTLWYVNQLKNYEPWGAKKIPLSFKDESLLAKEYSAEALKITVGKAESVSVDISPEVYKEFTNDPAFIAQGKMNYTYTGIPRGEGYTFTIAHQLVNDIIKQTKLERPIYFSMTCGYPGADVYAGLGKFCMLDGMAYRVYPYEVGGEGQKLNADVMEKSLLNCDNTDAYSTTFKYGFKMRNLNNPNVYYDEHHRRYIDNYRTLYIRYADSLLTVNQNEKAIKILDAMNQTLSTKLFPMTYALVSDVATSYKRAGADKQAKEMASIAIAQCKQLEAKPELKKQVAQFVDRLPPTAVMEQMYELMGEFENARGVIREQMRMYPNDPSMEVRLVVIDIDELVEKKQITKAIEKCDEYIVKLQQKNDPRYIQTITSFKMKAEDLRKLAGVSSTVPSRATQ